MREIVGIGVLDVWDYVRTGVNCMRWYVPSGNVGIEFTGDARIEGEEGCVIQKVMDD